MPDSESPPRNYRRRSVLGLLCLAPLLLATASLIAGLAGVTPLTSAGLWCMLPATLLAVLNFYLSFVRPLLHYWRYRSPDAYRHSSGFPILGSVLVTIACLLGFGAIGTSALGIVTVLLDTGGSPWFLFCTWSDSSLWDR